MFKADECKKFVNFYYRGKVMFTQVCGKNSVQRGGGGGHMTRGCLCPEGGLSPGRRGALLGRPPPVVQ